jgi:hypothetical protein
MRASFLFLIIGARRSKLTPALGEAGLLCYPLPMLELSLEELESLDPVLDLFTATPPVPEELLRLGLVPPLPVSEKLLAWGFPLLRAARAAGLARLACLRLEGLDRAELLGLALRLEGRAGAYRWSEKQAVLAYARACGFPLNELAPLIEGRGDPRLEEKIGQFAGLPPSLWRMVEDGELDLRAALTVRELPEPALESASRSRLTFSERREFLQLLLELAGRDRLSSAQVAALARTALAAPRSPAAAGPPALAALRELRLPLLADLRRRWDALERELVSGSGVSLEPPPFFEGDAIRLSFTFRSRAGLSRRLRALARVEERCDELLCLLR